MERPGSKCSSASHITLEAGLQTRSNVTLISEEIEAKKMSLDEVVGLICRSVKARAAQGKNYGVVLVPEGLVEFIPSIKSLIAETGGINAMIVDTTALAEQVTDAVVMSAFRSAGQRCSALRLLCLHEATADARPRPSRRNSPREVVSATTAKPPR